MSPLWQALFWSLLIGNIIKVNTQQFCGSVPVLRGFASTGVCCENRWAWVGVRNGACCGNKGYAPAGQICCGGKVSRKDSILSGCCYGKPYERNKQHCCGRELIDIKTHGCCRNEPFNKAFEECCEGERVPNLYDDGVPRECCGKELYNKLTHMCCAKKVVKKIVGDNTKCCIQNPYDERKDACCNKKIIPKIPGRSECCHGRMIDPRKEFCCDFKIQKRKYGESTGCCRLGLWKYTMYNTDAHICCARELRPRFSKYARTRTEREEAKKRISCCNQAAYDTKHEICCGLRVHRRRNHAERCCGSRTYDRSLYICCEGRKYKFNKRNLFEQRGNTYCCGKRKYDRRKSQCKLINKQYRVVSLNYKPTKKTNKRPDIEIFLAATTLKPFDPFAPWGKSQETTRSPHKSEKPDIFVLPTFDPNDGFDPFAPWGKSQETTRGPIHKTKKPDPFVLPTFDPNDGFDPFAPWGKSKETTQKPRGNTTPNPFVIPDFGKFDPFAAWANSKTTSKPRLARTTAKYNPFIDWGSSSSNQKSLSQTTQPSPVDPFKEVAVNKDDKTDSSLLELPLDLFKELEKLDGTK